MNKIRIINFSIYGILKIFLRPPNQLVAKIKNSICFLFFSLLVYYPRRLPFNGLVSYRPCFQVAIPTIVVRAEDLFVFKLQERELGCVLEFFQRFYNSKQITDWHNYWLALDSGMQLQSLPHPDKYRSHYHPSIYWKYSTLSHCYNIPECYKFLHLWSLLEKEHCPFSLYPRHEQMCFYQSKIEFGRLYFMFEALRNAMYSSVSRGQSHIVSLSISCPSGERSNITFLIRLFPR